MAEIDASLIDVTACGICCVRFGKHQDGEKRQLLRFVICFLSVIECSKSPCQPWDELQALRSHHSIIHSSQEKHFSSYSSWPRVLVAMSCLCGRLMGGWGGGGVGVVAGEKGSWLAVSIIMFFDTPCQRCALLLFCTPSGSNRLPTDMGS